MPAHRKPTAIPRFEDPGKFRVDVYEHTSRPGYRVITRNGRARPVERSVPTREEAERFAGQIWDLYQRGHYGAPKQDPVTLGELAKAVEKKDGIKDKTSKGYARAWALFVRHVGAKHAPRRVYQLHIMSFLSAVEEGRYRTPAKSGRAPEPCSAHTLATYLRTLRLGFNMALKNGWVSWDPTEDVTIELEHEMGPWLPYSEWEPYLTACSPYHALRSEVVLETGMREGEVAAARPEWIVGEVGRRAIVVPKLDPETGFSAKWGSSRPIPLTDRAEHLIALARAEWPASRFLFSEDGLSALGNLARQTREAGASSGVTRVTFHGLRRSAGAHWLDCGVPLLEVSRMLGHTDIRTTQKWYAGMSDSTLASAMATVERVRSEHAARERAGSRVLPLGSRMYVDQRSNDCGDDCGARPKQERPGSSRSKIRGL